MRKALIFIRPAAAMATGAMSAIAATQGGNGGRQAEKDDRDHPDVATRQPDAVSRELIKRPVHLRLPEQQQDRDKDQEQLRWKPRGHLGHLEVAKARTYNERDSEAQQAHVHAAYDPDDHGNDQSAERDPREAHEHQTTSLT
jgi:hypothetical protein